MRQYPGCITVVTPHSFITLVRSKTIVINRDSWLAAFYRTRNHLQSAFYRVQNDSVLPELWRFEKPDLFSVMFSMDFCCQVVPFRALQHNLNLLKPLWFLCLYIHEIFSFQKVSVFVSHKLAQLVKITILAHQPLSSLWHTWHLNQHWKWPETSELRQYRHLN